MLAARWTIAAGGALLFVGFLYAAAAQESPTLYDPAKDPLVNPARLFETAPSDADQIDYDAVLYRNSDMRPTSLCPLFMSSTSEFYFQSALFEGLFQFDADLNFAVNEKLVAEFNESADHKTYTVRLKPGLRWHDGAPLTAHDVVYSFKTIMDPQVPCPTAKTGTDELEDVIAVDDLTVKIVHKRALATNKWNALYPLIPKHIYEVDQAQNPSLRAGDYYNKVNRAPIGNGAYKFVEWTDERIVLDRWDEFPGPRPHFKRIVFRFIADASVLVQSFCKQDLDEVRLTAKQFATQILPGSDFAKVGSKIWKPQWSYSYLSWNMDGSNPFFGDVRVRRALAHACNMPQMLKDLTYGLSAQSAGIFARNSPWFTPVELIQHDRKRAAALLDEAGWIIDPERDGWRHKVIDGKPVKFEFTVRIASSSQLQADFMAVIQQDLKRVGIDAKTQPMEAATLQEQIRNHQYQAAMQAFGTGVDPDVLSNIWHSASYSPDGKSGRNFGGYKNARVDELFKLGRQEMDLEQRRKYYQELGKIIYDEQPYLFLEERSNLWGVSNRIRGVTVSPRGLFNYRPAEQGWWIPSSKYPGVEK
ncbi:MAG: ABC transporter substrate-binding protein [Planctomycetota bacterium]